MPARAVEPVANLWFTWRYVENNLGDITTALSQHVTLTVQAVVLALVVALPLAVLAHRRPRLAGPVLGASGVLYTVPALALFAMIYPLLWDPRTTVLIGLVMYALLVLVRNVLVGLQGVDRGVVDAARGTGIGPTRLLLTVELPLAIPSIFAGLRLATVSTVALVTIGIIVGYGGLGQLLYRGFNSQYRAEIATATVLTLLVALVADLLLMALGRALTPWARGGR
ncbi:quaternary ammonium transporter [Actinotalea ferrariae CF5-4]|uniref:Quaternary ammonium transporter n=1 Tax=Actinotalea ferrariae CF5-4 TaxID=948458 RepID=A0A021VRN8_9CELL|nr:quaternary ammonium transporter [Actinotalea ferrariae CF5-4]